MEKQTWCKNGIGAVHNPRRFSDRRCVNTSCSTDTTLGWDYVVSLNGVLCLDCNIYFERTNKLWVDPGLRDEDLFDESFVDSTGYLPLSFTAPQEIECGEDWIISSRGRYESQESQRLSNSELQRRCESGSIPITIEQNQQRSAEQLSTITSGSEHYMKSFQP